MELEELVEKTWQLEKARANVLSHKQSMEWAEDGDPRNYELQCAMYANSVDVAEQHSLYDFDYCLKVIKENKISLLTISYLMKSFVTEMQRLEKECDDVEVIIDKIKRREKYVIDDIINLDFKMKADRLKMQQKIELLGRISRAARNGGENEKS